MNEIIIFFLILLQYVISTLNCFFPCSVTCQNARTTESTNKHNFGLIWHININNTAYEG